MIKFDIETGTVFIRNYDQGVIETLGGYIDTYDISGGSMAFTGDSSSIANCLTSNCRRSYFIDVPLASPMKVPVIFNKPFPTFESKYLPSFLVTRLDASPAMERWHSIGAKQYRIPRGNAVAVVLANGDVVSGYEYYEELPQAMPFNLSYTIAAMARYEREAIPMLKKILSVYKPCSKILIKDSLCTERSYTVWNENGFSDISEIVDISDRMKAYSVEIKIEGELDLSDPEINPTALEIIEHSNVI